MRNASAITEQDGAVIRLSRKVQAKGKGAIKKPRSLGCRGFQCAVKHDLPPKYTINRPLCGDLETFSVAAFKQFMLVVRE